MKRMTMLLTLILHATGNSFGQSDTTFVKADHYTTKEFDVAIFPAYSHDLIPGQRFTPTRQEIDKAEAALRGNLEKLNQPLRNQSSSPVIHKNLKKYKRQYFGYIDTNGDRILLINCFWARDQDDPDRWLTTRIFVHDGGSYYWNVKFNLQKNELFDLYINGHA